MFVAEGQMGQFKDATEQEIPLKTISKGILYNITIIKTVVNS
jgi:hypothetical protein